MKLNLAECLKEFRGNCLNHIEDPFLLEVRVELTQSELAILESIVVKMRVADNIALANFLRELIYEKGSDLTALLLQICGLTRNKIVTDLQPYSETMEVPSGSDGYKRLHKLSSWDKSGPYLAALLRHVLSPLDSYENFSGGLEALNQATYPGYIRQQRAKEWGHQAEYRLAVALRDIGLQFEPIAKSEKPISKDCVIYGLSFDLAIPSKEAPKVVVISTIHISNPGEYGKNKSGAMKTAREILNALGEDSDRPVLLALIDGVGLRDSSILKDVLKNVDDFCQLSTLWKAAVIAADRMGRHCYLFGPTDDEDYFATFASFLKRYPNHTISTERPLKSVEAGRVYVSLV